MNEHPVPAWLLDEPIERSGDDILGFREPARLLADRLRACQQSRRALLVTVEGSFGSGKSSFCRLIAEHLRAAQRTDKQVDPLTVEFDAWRSGSPDTGAWSAVAWRLGEQAFERIHQKVVSGANAIDLWLGDEWRQIDVAVLADRRLHWTDVARVVSDQVLDTHPQHWVRTLDLYSDAPRVIPGRELSGVQGVGMLARLLVSAAPLFAAAATGPAGPALLPAALPAIGASNAAIDSMVEARKRATVPWAIGTVEYARELGCLLDLLANARVTDKVGPRGYRDGWRAILVVDELTRLPDSELAGAREALALLAEVPGLLVLLPMDDRVLSSLGLVPAEPGAEDPVTKLVHLRWPVPPTGWIESVDFVRKWSLELGLGLVGEARERDEPSRHLFMMRGVTTPRQFKRSLLWVWTFLTLPPCANLLERVRSGSVPLTHIFALLSDVGLFAERRLDRDAFAASLRKHQVVLLHLSLQPWDLREWNDRQGDRLVDADAFTRDLALCLRRTALIAWTGAPREEEMREGFDAYVRWRTEARGLVDGGGGPRELLDWLFADPNRLGDLWLCAHLASAARRAGFASGEAPTRYSEAVANWMDGDVLVQAASHPGEQVGAQAASLVLLGLVHPRLYAHLPERIRRGLDLHGLRALVDEASAAILSGLAAD